jgi:hypothetical protein
VSRGNAKLARLRQLARNGKLKWKPSRQLRKLLQSQNKSVSSNIEWTKFTDELPWNKEVKD